MQILVVVIFLVILLSLAFYLKNSLGLRVLMYHKITDTGKPDFLTVTTTQFEKQFQLIQQKGYNTISLSDLISYINKKSTLPSKPLLLTFDDGYMNNYTVLYPLLEKYQMKANIFLVSNFIKAESDNDSDKKLVYLHIDQIKQMSDKLIEFGLHSANHKSYNELTIQEIEADIKESQIRLQSLSIPFQPCFAYPYGAYPKRNKAKKIKLFEVFATNNIEAAFRIGNRINPFPLKNKYLIQRIDIRGNEAFWKFKIAIDAGKKLL